MAMINKGGYGGAMESAPLANNDKWRQVHNRDARPNRRSLVAGPLAAEDLNGRRTGAAHHHLHHHHKWLLSMAMLIVISMLARDCNARVFPGMQPSESGTNLVQQLGDRLSGLQARQVDPALGCALEPLCMDLLDSMINARASLARDARSLVDPFYLTYLDNERLKRASPKHTPRFGR